MQKIFIVILLLFQCGILTAQDNPDAVLVSRGGVDITIRDVDAYLQRVPEKDRAPMMDSPKRIESLLTNMLLTKQLAQQAVELKLDEDALFKKELEQARNEALARIRMQAFLKSIKVPDMDVLAREKYTANKEKYVLPEKVNVQHILISTKQRSDAEAQELAKTIRQEAISNPQNFDQLVERYSDDPAKAENHGVMQDATSSKYVNEFSQAASTLHKVDEISEVVQTKFGYHIIKLTQREPPSLQTFEEVREGLLDDLKKQYIETQRKDFVNELNNQTLDNPDPELLLSLRTRYLPAGAQLPSQAGILEKPQQNKAGDQINVPNN